MQMNILTVLSIWALLSLVAPVQVVSQGSQDKLLKKAAKVKEKIRTLGTGPDAKVKVKLHDKTVYQGYISEVTDDGFVVTDISGKTHPVQYASVDSLGGRNLSSGTKVAIGIGIGAGIVLAVLGLIVANAP